MNTALLVIDPQVDFMDLPQSALPVPGANADMDRVAAWLQASGPEVQDVVVTLDTHELLDIAHPLFWKDAEGRTPAPFTQVSFAQVLVGDLVPANPNDRDRVLSYLQRLEGQRKYRHMIWPAHCLIGTAGHAVQPALIDAIHGWEAAAGKPAMRVLKGQNRYTEHYSAVRAEVVDERDPGTDTNFKLLSRLDRADRILVAGEALSHCVRATVTDILYRSDRRAADVAKKLVLFRDATSSVPGFENQGEEFVEMLKQLGAAVTNLK